MSDDIRIKYLLTQLETVDLAKSGFETREHLISATTKLGQALDGLTTDKNTVHLQSYIYAIALFLGEALHNLNVSNPAAKNNFLLSIYRTIGDVNDTVTYAKPEKVPMPEPKGRIH